MNIEHMKKVAAAANTILSGLTEDEAIDAAEDIVGIAPTHIQDDFERCCAYFLYRMMLIKATENEDVGQMMNAQAQIQGLLE